MQSAFGRCLSIDFSWYVDCAPWSPIGKRTNWLSRPPAALCRKKCNGPRWHYFLHVGTLAFSPSLLFLSTGATMTQRWVVFLFFILIFHDESSPRTHQVRLMRWVSVDAPRHGGKWWNQAGPPWNRTPTLIASCNTDFWRVDSNWPAYCSLDPLRWQSDFWPLMPITQKRRQGTSPRPC